MILLPQPPELLKLQAWTTTPSLLIDNLVQIAELVSEHPYHVTRHLCFPEMCLRPCHSLLESLCLRPSHSLLESQAISLSLLCAVFLPCLFYSMPCYSSTVGLSVLLAPCTVSSLGHGCCVCISLPVMCPAPAVWFPGFPSISNNMGS